MPENRPGVCCYAERKSFRETSATGAVLRRTCCSWSGQPTRPTTCRRPAEEPLSAIEEHGAPPSTPVGDRLGPAGGSLSDVLAALVVLHAPCAHDPGVLSDTALAGHRRRRRCWASMPRRGQRCPRRMRVLAAFGGWLPNATAHRELAEGYASPINLMVVVKWLV